MRKKMHKGKKTLILDIVPKDFSRAQAESRLEELKNLIATAEGIVVEKIIQKRRRPSAKTFLGTGKIVEAADFVKHHNIELVIINGILKPNQYLHLRNMFPKVQVWDRTDLILHLLEKHASSTLAKLQIKLARLKQEIPKLYARDATTLFERAGAGIGTRGMGEKGIEEEKRHIRRQIKQVERKIEAFKKVQSEQRRARNRTGMKSIALVGYTNAGKSSLMQLLSKKPGIKASNALFTTLDTRIGKVWLGDFAALISDTIGFIEELPPNLIASFMTTLEEAIHADLLLHVVDMSDPKMMQKLRIVEEILSQIGAAHIPVLYVFNKEDKVTALPLAFRDFLARKKPYQIISCATKSGILELKKAIVGMLSS